MLNNEYCFVTLQEYLNIYHSELSSDWGKFMLYVSKAFAIKGEDSFQEFLFEMNLNTFDYVLMKEKYNMLKSSQEMALFDDDIVKFISYLYGFGYFERIGTPNLNTWLNAKNLNRPFNESGEYSLLEVIDLKNGGNAIRHKLLSSLNW